MNWDEYMQRGSTREDKLVVIYKVNPQLLSIQYLGILDAMFNNGALRPKLAEALPDLELSVRNWEDSHLQQQLIKNGADFLS